MIRQNAGRGGTVGPEGDILAARSLFDVAQTVGAVLREVMRLNRSFVEPYGDPSASFLVGGQIAGDGHRLFQVYSAGNFVEASSRNPFLQLGETKYGKPILDRALTMRSGLDEAAKLALLSFDATIRSNLSVAPPIDLLRYEAGSLMAGQSVGMVTRVQPVAEILAELATQIGRDVEATRQHCSALVEVG
jgi:putative proteasome-type protease